MKRETILFYISFNKIHIYLKNLKKEIIENVDTFSFFQCDEIKDVMKFSEIIEKMLIKKNIKSDFLKPNIIVLYNDITNSDIKYLYQEALTAFNYNNIYFYSLSELINDFCKNKKIIYYDGVCFTNFYNKDKTSTLNLNEDDYYFIGKPYNNFKYFSNFDILWEKFIKKYI